MKITKRQLRRIIKEEKAKLEEYAISDEEAVIYLQNKAAAYREQGVTGRSMEMLLMDDFVDDLGHQHDAEDYEGHIRKLVYGLGESKIKITKNQLRKIIIEALEEADNPCWDGYSPGAQSGVKTQKGKKGNRVANCEKIRETESLDEQGAQGPDLSRGKDFAVGGSGEGYDEAMAAADEEYYAAEDKRVRAAADDLPELAKAVEVNKKQASSAGGDMANMYEDDAYTLQHIHDEAKSVLPDKNGDFHGQAPEQLSNYMSRIDTAVREQIPLNLYNWIVGQD